MRDEEKDRVSRYGSERVEALKQIVLVIAQMSSI